MPTSFAPALIHVLHRFRSFVSLKDLATRRIPVATASFLVVACAAPEPAKHTPLPPVAVALPPPVALVVVPKPAPAPVPVIVAREPNPADLNAYKLVLAEKIAQSSKQAVKQNSPRPTDSSINGLSVIGLQIRADGGIDRAWVVRSSGDAKLDTLALDSVHAAAPLPPPSESAMVGRGYTIVAESWLHKNDGKFQLISKTLSTGSGVPDNLASNKSSKISTVSAPASKPAVKSAADTGGASISR
jgi:TonB family protein